MRVSLTTTTANKREIMNTLIKILSLALLLHIPTAYCMGNNAIIPVPSEPFTIRNIAIPNDILKQIFTYLHSGQMETIHKAKRLKKLQPTCKHWYHLLNPVAIRQMLNWKPSDIISEFINTWIRDNTRKFLIDTLKDIPSAYEQINMDNLIYYNDLDTITALLENGADPNFYYSYTDDHDKKATPLLYAMRYNKREMFKLILNHGGDIYQDAGNGYSVLRIATEKSGIEYSTLFGMLFYSLCMIFAPELRVYVPPLPFIAAYIATNMFCAYLCSPSNHIYRFESNDQWPIITILKEKYGKQLASLCICYLLYLYYCHH
jgi:hypothetical protein